MKLGDLFIKLGLQKGEFDKGIDDAKRKTSAFGSAMGKIGGMIAGVFAVGSLVNFGRELLTIAGQAEGVQKAFNKIATAGDLQNLRTATKGTVSDLELMKRAVMANNFDIPVQQLGKLFEFASKRAQDTGQSIDYLVDSIVIGIGRKSPLILDNLGISIVDLRRRLGGVSAETATIAQLTKVVGDIAEESFQKSGRLADTLGTKIVSLSVKWENFKLSLATNEGFVEFWKNQIDSVDKEFTIFFSKNLTKWEKFRNAIDISGNETDYLYNKAKNAEYVDQFLKQPEAESSGGPLETPKKVVTLTERIKKLNQIIAETRALMKPNGDATAMKGYYEDIQKAQEELDLLLKIQNGDAKKFAKGSIGFLEEEIKLLNEKIEKTTNPHILGVLQKELRIKEDILKQEKEGLKTAELKKISNKDITEVLDKNKKDFKATKGISILIPVILEPDTSKPIDTGKLVISQGMKTNMFNADKAVEDAQAATDYYDTVNESIGQGIGDILTTMASGFGEMVATGDWDWGNFGMSILETVGGFLQQLGALFLAYGIANLAFVKALLAGPTTMGAGLAIAAGIGLMAAGAAVSSFAQKGMSGGASSTPAASGYSNYSQSNASAALSGNVVFELEGTKLRGALNNTDRRNTLIR